ncbi:hypothetical protein Bpfe_004904 [Biomphalaria pfeifferi]|uniref:Lipoprotein n=1 Tax=Biomphalaria pfeifferi TaxID=112525 RepID=A0AAD8C2S7_BIOPF|nr:hypothetical protein Bpfe_004904 [Biomphalaria pfeifferi]
MASFKIGFIISVAVTLTSCAPAEKGNAKDDARLLSFLATISGYSAIDLEDNGRIIRESMASIPVDVPAFYPDFAYFYEEVVDGALKLRQVIVPFIGEDGFIHASQYNFTGWQDAEIGEFDVSVLQKLSREDFYTSRECDLVLTEIKKGIYMGNLPECESIIEYIPNFGTVWTCTSTGFINYRNPELNPQEDVPIIMHKDFRYPLPDSMLEVVPGFEDPCA